MVLRRRRARAARVRRERVRRGRLARSVARTELRPHALHAQAIRGDRALDRGAQRRTVRILEDHQVEPRGTPISLLYQSRSYVPLKVRAFMDFYADKATQLFGAAP